MSEPTFLIDHLVQLGTGYVHAGYQGVEVGLEVLDRIRIPLFDGLQDLGIGFQSVNPLDQTCSR